MPVRLVAIDEGPDIPLDRAMVVVGRHPQCDARLDSLRVSRHHCCMTIDQGEVIVRDLGSTNGIRINGQRVEIGRLRTGDELSIAHVRYRLVNGLTPGGHLGQTLQGEPVGVGVQGLRLGEEQLGKYEPGGRLEGANLMPDANRIAAEVREAIPSDLAERYRIQVIVQGPKESAAPALGAHQAVGFAVSPGSDEENPECRPDSSH